MGYIYKVIKNKTNQSRRLQIIGHVVAKFYANKRSMHGRRQFVFQKLLYNLRRWNYNCAFYYYYLIMEKIYKKTRATFYIGKNAQFTSFIGKRDATGKQI
jgi:hypothetical protein